MSYKKINIPNPCNENWDKMSPTSQGRFCDLCEKVVIDFTDKSEEEIIAYLESKKGERTCGRFSNNFSDIKKHKLIELKEKATQIRQIPIRYAAILVLSACIFIVGCDTSTQGELIEEPSYIDSPKNQYIDTPEIMGEVAEVGIVEVIDSAEETK